jgi:hypothetical protein
MKFYCGYRNTEAQDFGRNKQEALFTISLLTSYQKTVSLFKASQR